MAEDVTDNKLVTLLKGLFCKKSFSIKNTGLSYRVINNWSEKGLVNHFRKGKGKWHRLTFLELFETLIYKELKEIGFSIKKLLRIKALLNAKIDIPIPDPPPEINSFLSLSVAWTICGQNFFLLTNQEANRLQVCQDIHISSMISNVGFWERPGNSWNSLIVISMRTILDSMGVPYRINDEKFKTLLEAIQKGENEQDITVMQEKSGKIKKINVATYRNLDSQESINKLINQPNQKTMFHSNNHGAQKIIIEKEIK